VSNGAPEPAREAGPGWRTQVGIGVALLLVALFIWLDAQRLPVPTTVGVGPSAAMRLVAVLVAILGLAHGVAAWRHRARLRAAGVVGTPSLHGNLASVGWVLGGLFGLIALLQFGGGFIAASTWLFVGTARGFGERISPKSVIVGLVLASLVYFFFTKGLSLGLPAGPLERLFA